MARSLPTDRRVRAHTRTHTQLLTPPLQTRQRTHQRTTQNTTTSKSSHWQLTKQLRLHLHPHLLAYTLAGSGKTYTMAGLMDDDGAIIPEKRGLMPRCFEHLFALIARETQKVGVFPPYIFSLRSTCCESAHAARCLLMLLSRHESLSRWVDCSCYAHSWVKRTNDAHVYLCTRTHAAHR